MNLDLASLFPDLEALTPDGRWNALQRWLKENAEYGNRVEKWSEQTVDEVFDAICILAIGKYGALAGMVLMSPAIKAKLMRTIELLQACYRERQAYDNQSIEKEIKDVNHAKTRTRSLHAGNERSSKRRGPKRTDNA